MSSAVCRNVPAEPVKVPRVRRSTSSVIFLQVAPVVVSAMRMSRRHEPAQDDVGADALFLAVVDRAQVDDPA
jgi:hypothetical protein